MTIQQLIDLLKDKITPEAYQENKQALDDLERTIAVENMAAADSRVDGDNA